ncbi:hypothetical protein KZZ52_06555 [Dactylosporangium sp. AC04546]|uniref:hypothetical protein n=1 Tax=Dactylosporangium sp. AC04546 TaxID=2862460 RepID=UPI001EDCF706|nr:hypothetical protein [Dactylosporangium sp. AC04546]WVK85058.1 hypothetical protein KZZ52_06555 [Dactylosporangium sp. AC04546]
MKKRLQHLPAGLIAMAALLVVAVPVALWRDGASGAAGAVAGIGLVTLSYTLSSLIIAWADLKARHLLMPVAMGTYVVKFTIIGVAMWFVSSADWGGLPWMGALVIAAVVVWMGAHATWVWRAKIPYVEL